MEDVRERVRHLIDNSGATHHAFASTVGLEASKLSKSLSGTRRFRTEELTAIADHAEVSLEWLLHGVGPPPVMRHRPSPAGTGRRRVENREERRRVEILDATWRLIARRGYYRVRIADIAEVCGTSPAAIHYYFPGKQDVLQTSLLHCAERAYARQTLDLDRFSDAREQLVRLIELLLPVDGQIKEEWLIWLHLSNESALHPELRAVHNDFHLRWRDSVAQVIERGQAQDVFHDLDPRRTALTFMSLADGLAIQVLTATPGNSVTTMREVLTDFAIQTIIRPSRVSA
jgi:AcrR family transcriptional regulator